MKQINNLTFRTDKQLALIISRLGKGSAKIISDFVSIYQLKIYPLNLLIEKNHNKCCPNKLLLIIYQKDDLTLGRLRVCCLTKLKCEISRLSQHFTRPLKTKQEIYQNSYKAIRGSVGHVIFQSLLGINEKKYIRENSNIKSGSILRTVNYWMAPCSPERWDRALTNFQKDPSPEKLKEIICLYSPLYRKDEMMVNRMSQEIISYLKNLPTEWKKEEIRVLPTHLGMADLVVGNKIVEFKFTEKKLGWRKQHFEQLYHYYHSAGQLNPEEKQKIKGFCVFSPITGEKKELTVNQVNHKWNLQKNYQKFFIQWQWAQFSNYRQAEKSILTNHIKVLMQK